MRYLIKFSKESEIKFVAHLDLMRTIQRMMKRSGLPVMYSKGFNPHINLSLAQPLAVGVYSSGDYMDASFEEEVNEQTIKEALNRYAPPGIKIYEVVKIKEEENKRVFRGMAEVDAAKYCIKIKCKDTNTVNNEVKELLKRKNWNITKKSKKTEKEVDIKPLVKNFDFHITENILVIDAVVSCGSSENLSAELLARYIKDNTSGCDEEAFVDIQRKEMYAVLGGKLIPLYRYAKMR
ncbi:MAG: TIGR03936 family radical SAM-associated protein [Solirubrobacterales bacterium]